MLRQKTSKEQRASTKPSSYRKRLGYEEAINIITALVFAAGGWVLSEAFLPEELKVLSADGKTISLFSKHTCLYFKLLFGLSSGLLGLFASAYYFERLNWKRKVDEIMQELGGIQDRLLKMIEHTAFFTENNKLERTALNLLWEKTGGPAWIAAKFISKQLSESFSALKFDIDGDEYSNFSGKLYQECMSSIFLTSPFTPVEWFRQLYPDHADEVIEAINRGVPLAYDMPVHVESLISARKARLKRR
ncbi:MAG: hypothetical protein MUO85_04680, partial [candidate division Zixibacteria bacterium]|nr:hypothetical protein [candidate division Zixibacteria bacterium]